ncbi:DNA-binding response regulator (plasmid) [Pseudomonas lurida]|uniref:response regulator transcription factor n=1 Tax=Pseudomonas lurida TaxID=244566 RepID=UPI00083E3DED|nr:response regulator transcription factor [Pseudomonas lurida]AOE82506.1 DNA-binding response regulator [Pseudomonas lurida]
MVDVLIVDDHPFIRAAVAIVLKQEKFTVVAEAGDGVEALQFVKDLEPNLVVLDIGIPKLDGIEVISRIKKINSRVKVLILTSLPAELYSNRCRRLGAVGYISKTESSEELRRALVAIMSGYSVFPVLDGDLVNRTIQEESDEKLISQLSGRELEVLKQLALGKTNLEVSKNMFLSNKTISAHKKRILLKLNLSSQVAMAEFARRNNLIAV